VILSVISSFHRCKLLPKVWESRDLRSDLVEHCVAGGPADNHKTRLLPLPATSLTELKLQPTLELRKRISNTIHPLDVFIAEVASVNHLKSSLSKFTNGFDEHEAIG
jgi:hypothetical protein